MTKIVNRIKKYFKNDFKSALMHLIPRYKGVNIFKVLFWKMMKNHITKGFDESDIWELYYHLAKLILPRLQMFYNTMSEAKSIPYSYEKIYLDKYLKNGYKYDVICHRLKNKKANKEMFNEAFEAWKCDVHLMILAFEDIIKESEDYSEWHYEHQESVKACNHTLYDIMTKQSERKAYWDSFEFSREYHDGIKAVDLDFSDHIRKRGLKLFAEHFQSLWI